MGRVLCVNTQRLIDRFRARRAREGGYHVRYREPEHHVSDSIITFTHGMRVLVPWPTE